MVGTDVTSCYGISVAIDESSPVRRGNTSQTPLTCIQQDGGISAGDVSPSPHLQPFTVSHISIRPSKEVVTRRPSFRKTQLEMPSQLLTSDFTCCSQTGEKVHMR